jgi:hypothetical protein
LFLLAPIQPAESLSPKPEAGEPTEGQETVSGSMLKKIGRFFGYRDTVASKPHTGRNLVTEREPLLFPRPS